MVKMSRRMRSTFFYQQKENLPKLFRYTIVNTKTLIRTKKKKRNSKRSYQ